MTSSIQKKTSTTKKNKKITANIHPLTEYHQGVLSDLVNTDPTKLLNISITTNAFNYPIGRFTVDCLEQFAAVICASIANDYGIETHREKFNLTYADIEPKGTKLMFTDHALHCLDLYLGWSQLHDGDEERREIVMGNENAVGIMTELAVLMQWRAEHGVGEICGAYSLVQADALAIGSRVSLLCVLPVGS